jgi:hypothetical protein
MNHLWLSTLTVLVLLVGCRAQMPSFKPFSSLGSSRVAAPSTGSYGSPDSSDPYYRPPAQGAPSTTPSAQRRSESDDWAHREAEEEASERSDDDQLAWTAPNTSRQSNDDERADRLEDFQRRSSDVAAATYEEEVTDDSVSSNARGTVAASSYSIIPATAPRGSRKAWQRSPRTQIEFKGMPVNDATRTGAPAELDRDQVIDISELPQPTPEVSARLKSEEIASSTDSDAAAEAEGWRRRQ